jgi:hypothetical protein
MIARRTSLRFARSVIILFIDDDRSERGYIDPAYAPNSTIRGRYPDVCTMSACLLDVAAWNSTERAPQFFGMRLYMHISVLRTSAYCSKKRTQRL